MNKDKLSSQLLNAIDIGSDPGAIFRVRIDRHLSNPLILLHCLNGVGINQIRSASVSVVADLVIEQVVMLSTDDYVEFISLVAEGKTPTSYPVIGH